MKEYEIYELIDSNPNNRVETPEGELRGFDALLYTYITEDFGTDIYILNDGTFFTLPHNTHPADTSDVLAVIRCPGWSEQDTSIYEEESFVWDEKAGVWRDPYENNRVVKDPVAYLIREVGLQQEEDFLLKLISEKAGELG